MWSNKKPETLQAADPEPHLPIGGDSFWPDRVALDFCKQSAHRAGAATFQVSSLFSRYLFLNIFPFALNVYPCSSLHFSNSLGLFFSCSNADATASAPGMSESATTEKHVDSPRREIRRTNLEFTRKCLRPALSQ